MATTVWSLTLTSDDSGDEGTSFRNLIAGTDTGTTQLLSASLGQARVRFVASTAAQFKIDHASIGVYDPAGSPGGQINTVATPVELTFNTGQHGFDITGTTIVSDWVNLNWSITNCLVVIIDCNASAGGNPRRYPSAPAGHNWYGVTGATYNQAVNSAGTDHTSQIFGFDLIETQAGAGTYSVSGVTRDNAGNLLGSCDVFLLKYNSGTHLFTQIAHMTSSAVTGAFTFSGLSDNASSYCIVAWLDGTPHVFDISDRNITPV